MTFEINNDVDDIDLSLRDDDMLGRCPTIEGWLESPKSMICRPPKCISTCSVPNALFLDEISWHEKPPVQ
jgi:hypothetical protein